MCGRSAYRHWSSTGMSLCMHKQRSRVVTESCLCHILSSVESPWQLEKFERLKHFRLINGFWFYIKSIRMDKNDVRVNVLKCEHFNTIFCWLCLFCLEHFFLRTYLQFVVSVIVPLFIILCVKVYIFIHVHII